jgi:hypothetical protein
MAQMGLDNPPPSRPPSPPNENGHAPEYEYQENGHAPEYEGDGMAPDQGGHVQQPDPDPDPGDHWNWMGMDDAGDNWTGLDYRPPPRVPSQNAPAPEQVGHVQQPEPEPEPGDHSNWMGMDSGDNWMGLENMPPPRTPSQNEIGLAPEQVEHVQQPNPGPSSSAPPGTDLG